MRPSGLCVLSLLLLVGCGNLQVKREMSYLIDTNATRAIVDLELAEVGVLSDNAATNVLRNTATAFRTYSCFKTTNVFEYLFGWKMILVSEVWDKKLDKATKCAEEVIRLAEQPCAAPLFRQTAVVKEAEVLIYIKAVKDGLLRE